jgi:hypothetical protein
VKRRDLLKRIAAKAASANISWVLEREGANHSVYTLGSQTIPVPRHRDINDMTAEGIFKECEAQLGARWWK